MTINTNTRQTVHPIRVLIVEDSRSQRDMLVGMLEASGQFIVVGTASNGQEAVVATIKLRPQVIAMDIHLPVMDGFEATRQIMQRCPTPIVMISNSDGDAERRSMQSLAAGALTVVRKPVNRTQATWQEDRATFLKMLRLMSSVQVVTRHPPRLPLAQAIPPTTGTHRDPQILAIAASTGGPAAVQTVLRGLGEHFSLPVLVIQHISRGFVGAMVDWLNTTTPLTVQIASPGERMLPGYVYLPSDDQHLVVDSWRTLTLQPGQPGDRYCPSADVLFESVARVFGRRAIGVILTGMGDDGVRGLQSLHTTGGYILGQDADSCVVYGMPQAAFLAGVVTRVESLNNIAGVILALTGNINERTA